MESRRWAKSQNLLIFKGFPRKNVVIGRVFENFSNFKKSVIYPGHNIPE